MILRLLIFCLALAAVIYPTGGLAQVGAAYDELDGIPAPPPSATFFDRASLLTFEGRLAEHSISAVSDRRDQTATMFLFYRLDQRIRYPDQARVVGGTWVVRRVRATGLGDLISEDWADSAHCPDLAASLEALRELPPVSVADGSRDPLQIYIAHNGIQLMTRRAGMGGMPVSVTVGIAGGGVRDAVTRITRASVPCLTDQRPNSSDLLSPEELNPPRRSLWSILGFRD